MFFDQADVTRQALHSMKSALRLFSMQHLAVSRASVPAFAHRRPACLNRLQTICLQAHSATPDPTGNPRFRQPSQRNRLLLDLK